MTDAAAFDLALALILKHEGGFQKDPTDKGNWTGGAVGAGTLVGTNFGISAAAYPNEDIKGMAVARARELYYCDYWLPIHGPDLPFPLALVTFDAAVNSGVGAATRWLQAGLGVAVDGIIGPDTLTTAQKAVNPNAAAMRVTRKRIVACASFPAFATFGPSWVHRSLETLLVAVGVAV